jgi:hypothetical protein
MLVLLLFQSACATGVVRGTWAGGGRGVPSHYAQSCVTLPAGCTPVGSTGEIIVPTTVGRVVKAAEAVQGLLNLKDFLDEAEVARVEAVLVACAKEADFQVNEREYGPGKYPDDKECKRVVGSDSQGKVTRAMELGTMKHDLAFACVERKLGREFSDHLTREPRYGKKSSTGEYALTDERLGSLVPDIVLHVVRNANRIQFLYDFYFPCTSEKKENPLGKAGRMLRDKLDKYDKLPGEKRRALVTPQLGISR